jgi:D-glycero-D-manno-heptose 1,7-bisphosphate phosphatase
MRSLLLDRDGVINHDSDDFIRSAAQWRALPGSLEAIVRAQRAGYRIIVISNQSGLARGLFDVADLNAIHRHIQTELELIGGRIEAFFFCPHGPDDGCTCRKPGPGLLFAIQQRLGIDLSGTPFIGDRMSDVAAARSAGARPMLVRTGLEPLPADESVETFDDLAAAVDTIL